jgi:glutamine synthetase
VFRDSYEEAWAKAYRDLRPANDYNVDYSLLGTARIEPLLRRIRNSMAGAGLRVESAKGECNYGQHEIAFRYTDALATADGHVIYKNGAKEIAAQDGCSLTFMSKYNEREGNSCHIHFSLRSADGDSAVMAGDRRHHGYSELMEQFLAGQLACLRELTLFLAPNVNSYKRYAAGSFAPTAVAWGHDNRTCALRVVGHGHSLRLENRVPGGDVNPYLALAAIIAAGLHGVDKGLPPGGRVHRQRLHGRQAVRAQNPARGPRPVRRQRSRPPGLRGRRGRPLHQHGHRRAGRLRRRRDRLGAVPGLRAPVTLFEVRDRPPRR